MLEWLADNAWLIWIAIALILLAVEVMSVDFVFLMFAGGALAGAAAAAGGLNEWWQVGIACLVAAVLLVAVRPWVKARLMRNVGDPTIGRGGWVSASVVVLETVTERGGLVKLDGSTWSARLAPGSRELLPGQGARVVEIDGATAIVASEGNE